MLSYFFTSYCPMFNIRFTDFSWLCCHISEGKFVGSFHMKSNRSNSTFVKVVLLFHESLPYVQNSFSGLFLAMLLHYWIKDGNKLPYQELQVKFDFRHGWLNFLELLPIVQNSFSGLVLFLAMFSDISMKVVWKLQCEYLQMKFRFLNDLLPFLKKRVPDFSFFHMERYTSSLKHQIKHA